MRIVNVAKVVIENPDGDVLLLRRSKTDVRRPGQWDFPGGGIDPGESHYQAAVREAYEEAGLVIGDLIMLYCATEHYKTGDESVNRALFHAKVEESAVDSVTLSFEHDDYKWVSKEQAAGDFQHPFYGVGLRYAIDNGLI